MKEMIRKYRGTLISSALVILAGVLVGFTSIQGKWINLFFVVMQCVFVAIIFYDNRNRQQNRKVIGMTIWIIPVITLLYNGIVRLVDMGADIENLFMAGRNISVTHIALGAIRVQRTTGMMGEVVGMAAYLCMKYRCSPRQLYTDYLQELLDCVS